jgi:predicted  nucleic acid-binding Zn-ribbon protein
MAEIGYYSDGVTKFTDPFYQCVCRGCLHRFWSVLITSHCPECGCEDVFRSFDYREADAESARLKNK